MKKKIISQFLILIMSLPWVGFSGYAQENEEWFFVPQDVLQDSIKNNDYQELFETYFFPNLNTHLQSLLLFVSEMNISNGRVEKYFGERHVFGKLQSANSVMLMDDNEIMDYVDLAYGEGLRLLFGPWQIKGNTTMKAMRPKQGKNLSQINGDWIKAKNNNVVVKVVHHTEFFDNTRVGWFSITYKKMINDYFICRWLVFYHI